VEARGSGARQAGRRPAVGEAPGHVPSCFQAALCRRRAVGRAVVHGHSQHRAPVLHGCQLRQRPAHHAPRASSPASSRASSPASSRACLPAPTPSLKHGLECMQAGDAGRTSSLALCLPPPSTSSLSPFFPSSISRVERYGAPAAAHQPTIPIPHQPTPTSPRPSSAQAPGAARPPQPAPILPYPGTQADIEAGGSHLTRQQRRAPPALAHPPCRAHRAPIHPPPRLHHSQPPPPPPCPRPHPPRGPSSLCR
jgi:hypothetical protein